MLRISRSTIPPELGGGAVLALLPTALQSAPVLYLQYTPLRVLAPAVSLLAVLWWDARQGWARAAALGAAGVLAAF